MAYIPKNLKDKKLPKTGTKVDGNVKEIQDGILSDFVKSEILHKWENATGKEKVINIVMELETGDKISKIIRLPENDEVHPKSAMGLWKKQFGDYPTIGQEIFAMADSEGRFVVPKI